MLLQKFYSLESAGLDEEFFLVDSTTGRVSVKPGTLFDRETKAQYFIKVKAVDGAPSVRPGARGQPNSRMYIAGCESVRELGTSDCSPYLVTEVANVQIDVTDVNDNPPSFPQSQYYGSAEETALAGTKVTSVVADDLDIDNNFGYSFVSGNTNQAFDITDSGDIVVLNSVALDYETKKVCSCICLCHHRQAVIVGRLSLSSGYHYCWAEILAASHL